jgi:hypothetical protein
VKPEVVPSRYIQHTRVTDPAHLATCYTGLPDTIPELVKVVQGLLLHPFWANRYGVTLTDEQETHVQARLVSRILEVIISTEESPLTKTRAYDNRFIGNCRDFTVLLCSILRHKGVPARARCGFGAYFRPGWYEDHWICEYWNGRRWVGVDAQIDETQSGILGIDFDVLDMPPGKFIPASQAWLLCRAGSEDPDKFGIFDMHGFGFIRGNVLRELAAFTHVEMLPWDVWGLMEKDEGEMAGADFELLDRVAEALNSGSEDTHRLYQEHAVLQVPPHLVVAGV